MVGIKLLWTGLTIIVALQSQVSHAYIIGGIFMAIGLVLAWLEK